MGGLQCYVAVPAYFAGTVVVTIPNYDPGYPQIAALAACPYVPQTQSGPHGDTYTLSFPLNGAQYQFSGSPPGPGADATVAFPVYYDN